MNKFKINANEYLKHNIISYYHIGYTGYKTLGNPDYLNDLKNTFGDSSKEKLDNAKKQLYHVLKTDLSSFSRDFTVCIVPRSKAENTYSDNQLLFKKTVQSIIHEFGFQDGSNYIIRHADTKTTHLAHSPKAAQYAGNGSMPYIGITKDTCNISDNIRGKRILLIDDIYTAGVNIDEDAIQTLLHNGAKFINFYAVGKTV